MKIPSEIKKKIKNCYKHSVIALQLNRELRDWLEENDLANDTNIDQLIDTLELGQGTPESLIEFLEIQGVKGNQKEYIR